MERKAPFFERLNSGFGAVAAAIAILAAIGAPFVAFYRIQSLEAGQIELRAADKEIDKKLQATREDAILISSKLDAIQSEIKRLSGLLDDQKKRP
jgi:uncharacterized protein HemX